MARRKDLRERILDATAELIASSGYHAVNTNAIARVAGCSVGSVYVYFSDKHAVLDALLERSGERLLAEVAAPVAAWSPGEDWRPLVRSIVAVFVRFYTSETGYRDLWVGAQLSESTRSAGQAWRKAARSQFTSVLRGIRPELALTVAEMSAEVVIHAVSAVVAQGLTRDEPALFAEAGALAVRYLEPVLEPRPRYL